MAKKITEQREDELMADFALRVLERIETGEEKTISYKEFFENAKQT